MDEGDLYSSSNNAQSPESDKPYHSKRPHKKSRSGCKKCKARKVKCDEARPVCRSCRLRRVDCVYPNSPPPQSPSSTAGGSPRAQTPGEAGSNAEASSSNSGVVVVVGEPQYRPSDVDQVDMQLLWFYTTTTFASFAVEAGRAPNIDNILKVRIPQEAFHSPFLMNCLFGLSALHLQSLKQDIDPSRAVMYRAKAFEGYRKAIEEAKPETFPALLASSLLLTALASQMFREKDTKELYIIDWMVVWRGIGLIVDLISPQKLWESGMAELFFRPPIDLNRAALSIPNNLLFMISSIKMDSPEYENVAIYYDTLKYLGSLYAELQNGFGPIMNLRIITWFTFLPKPFIELARQKKERALVIVAHYLIFTKLVEDLWWLSGIGNREIRGIYHYLGEEWYPQLNVPRQAVHIEDQLEIARLLMNDPAWTPTEPYDKFEAFRDPRTKTLSWVDDMGKPIQFNERWIRKNARPDSSPSPAEWNYGPSVRATNLSTDSALKVTDEGLETVCNSSEPDYVMQG
jgi:hypothetical protein